MLISIVQKVMSTLPILQLYPVYLLWNRRKTLTGSPDPTCANGTNKLRKTKDFLATYTARTHLQCVSALSLVITARKRSLGQGNNFKPVSHSVHRGVGT